MDERHESDAQNYYGDICKLVQRRMEVLKWGGRVTNAELTDRTKPTVVNQEVTERLKWGDKVTNAELTDRTKHTAVNQDTELTGRTEPMTVNQEVTEGHGRWIEQSVIKLVSSVAGKLF